MSSPPVSRTPSQRRTHSATSSAARGHDRAQVGLRQADGHVAEFVSALLDVRRHEDQRGSLHVRRPVVVSTAADVRGNPPTRTGRAKAVPSLALQPKQQDDQADDEQEPDRGLEDHHPPVGLVALEDLMQAVEGLEFAIERAASGRVALPVCSTSETIRLRKAKPATSCHSCCHRPTPMTCVGSHRAVWPSSLK